MIKIKYVSMTNSGVLAQFGLAARILPACDANFKCNSGRCDNNRCENKLANGRGCNEGKQEPEMSTLCHS